MNTMDSPAPYADASGGLIGLSQRVPPSNLQAEQALLGALLANNKAYERVSEFLAPEHFADAVNGRIYRAIGPPDAIHDRFHLRYLFEGYLGLLAELDGMAQRGAGLA